MKTINIWMVCMLFVVAWWGALYPEFSIRAGTCRVYDENGNEITYELSEKEAARFILSAKPDEVKLKSALADTIYASIVAKGQESGGEKNENTRGDDYNTRSAIPERGRGRSH